MPGNFDMTLLNDLGHYASWLFIVLGSFFILVGTFGLLRMPDVFTRMHAASVSDTLGSGFLILGLMLQAGLSLITLKLVFILGLLFMTGPVSAHALAQAALHAGAKPILHEDRRTRDLGKSPVDYTSPARVEKSKGRPS
jgi:multicomponent Na+:H+ antiporter subunit G